jgi:RecA DNA recombination protein
MAAAQALALEQFLAGRGFAKKPNGTLLSGSGARLLRACDLPATVARPEGTLATRSPLDALLGGLAGSKLVEIVGRRSTGRFSIAVAALASATSDGQDAALVDLGSALDPQAAEKAGVDLTRLLWVRPHRVKEALAAAEMLLATGFRLVVADMGLAPRGGRFVPDAAWVRLSRAVAAQESTLLLLTPYRMSGVAADAVVAAHAARSAWEGSAGGPRLLSGIAGRLTLEKLGRETLGRSAPLLLGCFPPPASGSPAALDRNSQIPDPKFSYDHPIALRSCDHPMGPNRKSQIANHKFS